MMLFLPLYVHIGCHDPAAEELPTELMYTRAAQYTIETRPNELALILEQCTQMPCILDVWSSEKKELLLLRQDQELFYFSPTGSLLARWPASWSRLNGPLSYCIGDPLQHHHSKGGISTLVSLSEAWIWTITIEEPNPCMLTGKLRLNAIGEQIDTEHLEVASLPWKKGGAEKLNEIFTRIMVELEAQKIQPLNESKPLSSSSKEENLPAEAVSP